MLFQKTLPALFLLLLMVCLGFRQQVPGPTVIRVRIFDDHGQLTAARVRFSKLDGQYLAPKNHRVDFPITNANTPVSEERGVVLDNDRRFAYVDGSFQIELPAEPVRIEIVKGFRYRIYDDTLEFTSEQETLDIQLEQSFAPPEDGWYSGDVHVHYINPETALLEAKAEDLNVCNILISDFTVDQDRFTGKIEPISDSNHIIIYGQEYREDRLGHVNILNLKDKLVEPAGTQREHQYPLNLHAADAVHQNQGHISWAHFAAWPGLEGPLGLVLKKVDAVELLCTIDPFYEPIFASDVIPEVRMNSGLRLWYRLLNCGLQIPITAGTDKMNNQVSAGANRVFARLDSAFNYDDWIKAINEGKTFVSNSPFLSFKVNGQDPGSLLHSAGQEQYQIVAEVWSQLPIDRLEIIANGELLAEKAMPAGTSHARLEFNFQPDKSSWITARAYQFSRPYTRQGLSLAQRRDAGGGPTLLNQYFGTLRPETVFAHSSPVYLLVDEEPIRSEEDATYFIRYLDNSIKWLDTFGSFPSEAAKKEVLEAFRSGRKAFEKLAAEGKQ